MLEKDRVYDVRQDDSYELRGYYCSNTAKQDENPEGLHCTAIYLKEKKNIVIDGNGATLLVHGKMTPLLFDRCENITVKNLKIDYACPTMAEFTVVSNNDGECIFKINKECLFRLEDNEIIWQGEKGADGKPYWEHGCTANKRYTKLHNPETKLNRDFSRNNLAFESVEMLDEFTLKVRLKNKDVDFPAGSIIQSRSIVRDRTGSFFERCKNLVFENCRVMFMHGLGMVSQFCENVTFRNCDFTPKEGRTIASTADFFQFSGCRGNLIIDSCKAGGAHDDYVNVHGTHLQIVDVNEKNITVRFMHPESWGFQAFETGDELDFIKCDTLIPYASAKVIFYERINDTDIRLKIDVEVPTVELCKDVVENKSWTPNLYVRNCEFGPTSGRGILCTTRGEVIIENNRFEKLWGPALLIEDDCNFWFESGYTTDITFRNNAVSCCEYAAMWEGSPVIRCTPKVMDENSSEYVHGKLTVTGNKFENPPTGNHLILLEYMKEAVITDNIFDAPYSVKTKCVGNVTDKNNTVK
ncbi:MAG: hypothetical protein E7516_06670 [Ruminococcaceae bacterium]|nr:hypothetical protein [Oscillospiraceae bacterium]